MIPGLAEMLLVANLAVGAPATPSPVVDLPVSAPKISAQAVQPLSGPLAQTRFSDGCCKPTLCNCACK